MGSGLGPLPRHACPRAGPTQPGSLAVPPAGVLGITRGGSVLASAWGGVLPRGEDGGDTEDCAPSTHGRALPASLGRAVWQLPVCSPQSGSHLLEQRLPGLIGRSL